MHAHLHKLVVIEAGAAQRTFADIETERLDEMKAAAGIGGKADDIASIRRDFWLK
ncbi:hypothetical protein MASR1M60_06670 [Rhodocyclaceae bacterium]